MKYTVCDKCGSKDITDDARQFWLNDDKSLDLCDKCWAEYKVIHEEATIASRKILKKWWDSIGEPFEVDRH